MGDFFNRWRRPLLYIFAALLLAALILTGTAFARPAETEKSVTAVNYEHRGSFNYIVTQKSSYTYDDLSLDTVMATPTPAPAPSPLPPQAAPRYPAEYVDRVDLTFDYRLTTGRPVNAVSEVTEVSAVYQIPGEKAAETIIVPPTSGEGNFKVSFSLAGADLKAATSTTIKASVLTTIDDAGNPVFETFSQSLVIKSDGTVLEVDKVLTSSQKASFGDLAYEQAGTFDYAVHLTANSPFGAAILTPPVPPDPVTTPTPSTSTPSPSSQKTLRPGDTIYANLFEKAGISYTYQLRADTSLKDVNEQTEIHIEIGEPGTWSKTFPLVPSTAESGPFTVNFDLTATDLNLYRDVYKAVQAEIGGKGANDITIVANTRVSAATDFGPIMENFRQTLSTTLGENTLAWQEDLQSTKTGTIQQTQLVTGRLLGLPVTQMRYVSGALAAVFLGLLLLLLFMRRTFKPMQLSPIEIRAAAAQKKYREFIVDVKELSGPDSRETVNVGSLEELARISDSLGKPVLHLPGKEQHTYSVIDGSARYRYILK